MSPIKVSKRVGFFDNSFSYRGTTRALIDYCYLASKRLDWQCEILFNIDSPHNSKDFICECLESNFPFPIHGIQDPYGLKNPSALMNYENLYFETVGIDAQQKEFLKKFKGNLLVHQIGHEAPYVTVDKSNQKSYYCSYWQSFRFSGGRASVLPYLVDLSVYTDQFEQANARKVYNIPKNALVLGRHGGADTWNLPFVNEAIAEVLNMRSDLWFVFVNTPIFLTHPRVIFLNTMTRREDIMFYIAVCDAMIHARWEGETFGLACTEFLLNRKPIITWSGSRERSHIYFADHSAIIYNSKTDLMALLLGLDKSIVDFYAGRINHDLFTICGPSNIAPILESVFK